MKRGDVFWAEQRGRRPVIVVSNDGFNMTAGWQSVIVVPVSTSEAQARPPPLQRGAEQQRGACRAHLDQRLPAGDAHPVP